MCGLVGIGGDLRYQDEFTMKRLLLADYFRGPDSTGLAAVRTNGDIHIAKISSNPIDLFGMTNFNKVLNGNLSRVFIGHNRLATRGVISTLNAHPFNFGDIVGAHNGTLDKESTKALEDKLGEVFPVDSMALFAAIDKFGIDKTIKMCYEGKTSTDGAWAISWFDNKDHTLNFLRNQHRPLYYAFEAPKEDGEIGFKRMFWASEWWMIREALASSTPGYKIYTEPNSTVGFFPFEPDVHYKFDLEALCQGSKTPPKPKVKKLKGKEVVEKAIVPFESEVRTGPWPRGSGTHTTTATRTNSRNPNEATSTTTSTTSSDKRLKTVNLIGDKRHPYANIVDEEKFKQFTQGCYFCHKSIEYGDKGISLYEREAIMLCRECTGYRESIENPPSRIYVRPSVIEALS